MTTPKQAFDELATTINRQAVIAMLVELMRIRIARRAVQKEVDAARLAISKAEWGMADCLAGLRVFGITEPDLPALYAEYNIRRGENDQS